MITGQKPVATMSRKAISNFKLREKLPIGVKVTLRNVKMYEFMDRLISVALPRVRDFRGVNDSSFDGRGNFTMGITEQIIFPEVDLDKINKITGMDITFVTTAKTEELIYMSKKSIVARQIKREKMVAKFADLRAKLKSEGNWEELDKLPKNSCKVRLKNRCQLTGRPKGYMRRFGVSRYIFRMMALDGKLPGVTKASW